MIIPYPEEDSAVEVTVVDFAPDCWYDRVVASAVRRWPGCTIKRVKLEFISRKGYPKLYRTYGAFLHGELVGLAKVNRAGAVYWPSSWLSAGWEVE